MKNKFKLAPDTIEEALLNAENEGHGVILALNQTNLYGVEGQLMGKVGGVMNVSFTAVQVSEILLLAYEEDAAE